MMTFRSRHSLVVSDPPRPRAGRRSRARIGTRILLLVALAASSVALTQCRMVGDRLTGIRVDVLKRKGDCIKGCKDTFRDAKKAETDLHAAAIRDCAGNRTCLAQEAARHEAALQAIEAAYVACQNGCHNQGAGTVGP